MLPKLSSSAYTYATIDNVPIPSPKVFHSLVDCVGNLQIAGVVGDFGFPPVPRLILFFAEALALIFVNTLPSEYPLGSCFG
jgi:hypothetical protein